MLVLYNKNVVFFILFKEVAKRLNYFLFNCNLAYIYVFYREIIVSVINSKHSLLVPVYHNFQLSQ